MSDFELTPEQEERIKDYVAEGLKIGSTTTGLDPERAFKAISGLFAFYDMEPPKDFLFFANPKDAFEGVKERYGKGIAADMQSYSYTNFGQLEIYWIIFYRFCKEVLGVEYDASSTRQLKLWGETADTSFFWWVTDGKKTAEGHRTLILADRPSVIAWDDAETPRLHNATGPALGFRGGSSHYYWHGESIPSEWITDPKSLTPEIALTWKNLDQRQAAAEILGWDKIIEQLDAKVIDKDVDPMVGTLLEVDLPDAGPTKFLKAICGTGRTVVIRAYQHSQTALEAQAKSYGVSEDIIKAIEVRT